MDTMSTILGIPLDELIPAEEIRHDLPRQRNGKPINAATVARWCRHGILGGVKLKSTMIAGRRYVTRRDVREFLEACSRASGNAPAAEA
jgi:hypothetical protein